MERQINSTYLLLHRKKKNYCALLQKMEFHVKKIHFQVLLEFNQGIKGITLIYSSIESANYQNIGD